jgi:altronate dehydratase
MINLKNSTFRGYRRENGRVGVRNHVVILPVDDLSARSSAPAPIPTSPRSS